MSIVNNTVSFGMGVVIMAFQVVNPGLKIEVASAFYPLAQEILGAQEVESGVRIRSTNEVYHDIISGRADAIVVTDPSDEQRKMIEESGVELEFKVIAKEPLAILVNSKNQTDNLNVAEIQEIYYGENPEWHTYQLEKNNGSQTYFEDIVKNNTLERNHFEIGTMPEIIDRVAEDMHGIGYAFYSYYTKMYPNKGVRMVKVDEENVTEEGYPLRFNVYFAYRANEEKVEELAERIKSN